MATQLETFRLLIPEFASTGDTDVQKFLDIAPLIIDPLKYSEESRGLALVYQAASLLYQTTQSANGNSSGMDLTMEKEGDLTRQYGGGASNRNGKVAKDIYLQMLDTISLQFAGATIMTRVGI